MTVTDVSTTCAEVIFRVKVSCITSVDGIILLSQLNSRLLLVKLSVLQRTTGELTIHSGLRSPERSNSTFWNDSWVQTFHKGTNKIQGSIIQRLNFKTVWSNLTSQETALKSINVLVRLPKILRIFCFQKSLQGLDNLLPSAPVRVAAP